MASNYSQINGQNSLSRNLKTTKVIKCENDRLALARSVSTQKIKTKHVSRKLVDNSCWVSNGICLEKKRSTFEEHTKQIDMARKIFRVKPCINSIKDHFSFSLSDQ